MAKKRRKFAAILLSLAMIGMFAGCSAGENSSSTDQTKPETNQQSKLTPQSTDQENPGNENITTMSLETISTMLEAILKENYGGDGGYNVSYDDTGITINVWVDGVAADIIAIQAAGGGADNEFWVFAKENTLKMAVSTRDLMDSVGQKDALLVINLLNDINQENALLSILNDTIIYDALA